LAPSEARLQNFLDMWTAAGFGPALLNSVLVSVGATALCLLVAIPAAYAGARLRFRGQGLFRQFLLVTQMLSPIVLVLGIFRLMARMGLVDSLSALVLAYAAFNLAFAVWMLSPTSAPSRRS
jgi:multiple sugar transport system permease protein